MPEHLNVSKDESMLDHSVMVSPKRLARKGEELLVHRLPNGTKALAACSDVKHPVIPFPIQGSSFRLLLCEIESALRHILIGPAPSETAAVVCVRPGTRLLLRDIPEHLQRAIDVRPVEEVTFIETNPSAFSHRDAVHFRNGYDISLQRLEVGQRVRVLALSLADRVCDPDRLAPAG